MVTDMDVYDRLVAEEVKQASVVLASFSYHALMRDERITRAEGLDKARRCHK